MEQTTAKCNEECADKSNENYVMRSELTSTDSYNKKWRATYGYCVAFSWVLMFITLFMGFIGTFIAMIFMDNPPVNLVDVCEAWSKLATSTIALWGIALAILGVNIKKRSDDKQTAIGSGKRGLVEGLASLVKK